jgi:hypothetical protein
LFIRYIPHKIATPTIFTPRSIFLNFPFFLFLFHFHFFKNRFMSNFMSFDSFEISTNELLSVEGGHKNGNSSNGTRQAKISDKISKFFETPTTSAQLTSAVTKATDFLTKLSTNTTIPAAESALLTQLTTLRLDRFKAALAALPVATTTAV